MVSGALHARHRTIFLPHQRAFPHLGRHRPSRTCSHDRRLHRFHSKMNLILPLGRHIEHRRQHPRPAFAKLGFQPLFQMLVLKNTGVQLTGRMLDHFRKTVELLRIPLPVLHHLIAPHHNLLGVLICLQRLPQESGRPYTPFLQASFQFYAQLCAEILHRA